MLRIVWDTNHGSKPSAEKSVLISSLVSLLRTHSRTSFRSHEGFQAFLRLPPGPLGVMFDGATFPAMRIGIAKYKKESEKERTRKGKKESRGGYNQRKETVSYQRMRSSIDPSPDKAEAEEATLLFEAIAARALDPCFYSMD